MYAAIVAVIVVSCSSSNFLGWVEQRFLRPEKRASK
jgi:hypothetical protein